LSFPWAALLALRDRHVCVSSVEINRFIAEHTEAAS